MTRVFVMMMVASACIGTGHAQSIQGKCNTVVNSNKGSITINCSEIPQEVAGQIAALLNLLLSQKAQTSDIDAKLRELNKSFSEMNERSRTERISLRQRVSDRRYLCETEVADLARRVGRRELPNSPVYMLSSGDNDWLPQLRSAIGTDGAKQLNALQRARNALESKLQEYAPYISLPGLESAYSNLPPASVASRRSKADVIGTQVINSFATLCGALKDVEAACNSKACTN